jgi:hypothetical protein
MDDLLAKLCAGPSGSSEQDRATMHRAAHEIRRLQAQLEDVINESIKRGRQADELFRNRDDGRQPP